MISFRFKNVRIESFAVNLPSQRVTSEEIEKRLEPLYKKLKIPFGTLEKLTNIRARHFWGPDVLPSQVSTVAAHKALETLSFAKDDIRAVFSCSITRDYFEPSSACIVHHDLGLAEDSLVLDITNACLGFMNGLTVMSNLIESGIVRAGLVVSGETITRPFENCVDYILAQENLTRDELIQLLPTLTLGSGAVAYVLCHSSLSDRGPKVLGGVTKSDSANHDLCNGNGDFCISQMHDFNPIMRTESQKLISAAATLGGRTWKQASEVLGWSADDIDHIFCHQVGKQVNEAFYNEVGVDYTKEFTIYQEYGNLASAALPTALVLGSEQKEMKRGDKVLMLGYGSGINSNFLGLEW
ncbi:MAG: 3-oxoacyl-ACP synthase III [Bdellovibrionales bacterium]|nr:3-oxoacyl-ACP synthase III [Bdellovibrionales bacterium]